MDPSTWIDVGAFQDAVRALGVPICHCGEMRLVEYQGDSPCGTLALWLCNVCSHTFVVLKVAKP